VRCFIANSDTRYDIHHLAVCSLQLFESPTNALDYLKTFRASVPSDERPTLIENVLVFEPTKLLPSVRRQINSAEGDLRVNA
jgi:hypothetical protein